MKGRILDYTIPNNCGIITGDDGKRYKFTGGGWKAQTSPAVGDYVDFEANDQEAHGIYIISNEAGSVNSKRLAASLLAFFLGGLGVHKFYLGINKPAAIMLCIWIFGWIFFGIPSILVSLIAFIEFIIYISKSDADFKTIYVDGKKEWF